MSEYISDRLRALVAQRAGFTCEYCLLAEADAFHAFHIDHIVSLKHGGTTEVDNLAFACPFCNRNKGSDVGTILPETGEYVRFFHPRLDSWSDHFFLEEGVIHAVTPVGHATVNILRFNEPQTVEDRRLLIRIGRYPLRSQ